MGPIEFMGIVFLLVVLEQAQSTLGLDPIAFCILVVGLTIILKSWYDCGSDHEEEAENQNESH